jgi:major intracellular serine protease
VSKVYLIPFEIERVNASLNEMPRGIRMIQAPALWKEGDKGEDVVVDVLDTGRQPDHPDLKQQIIGGYNFTNDF